uniref:Ovule protein n=1 Tax=Steinernema glaseri TaxID=37863 RepID=A0A1I7XZC4_9BILA
MQMKLSSKGHRVEKLKGHPLLRQKNNSVQRVLPRKTPEFSTLSSACFHVIAGSRESFSQRYRIPRFLRANQRSARVRSVSMNPLYLSPTLLFTTVY